MRGLIASKQSPALTVSIIALVVAVTGTAIAASGRVSGDKLIKKHSLSGNRLRSHTLTGAQIKLSKLGTVPMASNANTANTATTAASATTAGKVNGQQVQPLFTTATAGAPSQQFLNLGGVTITVSCASGTHQPTMSISNSSAPHQAARINIETTGAGPTTYETQGDFSSTTLLASPTSNAGTGVANAVFADKHVVTINYSYENNASGVFGDCTFSGHAISG